jgi:UDP-N-acetyl-D-mannosaminuronic acid transferase (WecB/TagA/CpsF family)
MECYKDHVLRDIINRSAANFPDGKGLVMGLSMLGHHLDFKVRGTDLMLKLCAYEIMGDVHKIIRKFRAKAQRAFLVMEAVANPG